MPTIDPRLLDGIGEAEVSENFNRVLTLIDAKTGFGTAVNAVAATGTLTFSGVVADGETVTIGDDVYEFDADSDVTAGNIAVDVSGGLTAPAAVTALGAAITGNTGSLVSAADGAGDTVVLTAKTKGTAANAIATTTTCVNGAWGATTLSGGVDGTVAAKGAILVDADKIYVATDDNTISDTNWKYVALT